MVVNKFDYDAVFILSQSDWYTEMRSNRYNFAKRFSNLVPVYFVQIHKRECNELVAGIEENITIVNPIHGYTSETLAAIFSLVKQYNLKKILIWMYSPYYVEALQQLTIPFVAVFHATEAFFGSNFISSPENKEVKEYLHNIRNTINFCSLVVAVSEGVAEGIRNDEHIVTPVVSVTNGCDFAFWNGFDIENGKRENVVLYQGGIHRKIDFSLLLYLIEKNLDIQFWFCGEETINKKEDLVKWKSILSFKNVTFFGKLHPDKVRELSHKAKVGIIPFKNEDWLTDKSFPLKAFEYLASGLSVVSTPIKSLQNHEEYFWLSADYEQFNNFIKEGLRTSLSYTKDRISLCKNQDYDKKFTEVINILSAQKPVENIAGWYKKKILFLYDIFSCHVNTIREHVNAFGIYSESIVTFYNASRGETINKHFLNSFDAVVMHYSIRISQPGYLSENIFKALLQYNGLKLLLIQDEYDNLASTYKYMQAIKFDIVFTCVPEDFHEYVYPKSLFPNVKLVNNFTGYISYNLHNFKPRPIKERSTDVFYRGRKLPYFYGSLGVEKYEIGIKFKQKCDELGAVLNLNLESSDAKRIYGDIWYKTIADSKAMLGTESGANVFDFKGNLQKLINQEIKEGSSYESIFKKLLEPLEQQVKMNQVSPKLFEAISLKTVLILYEGEYSNILTPHHHYIPLKKDFSNISEVLNKLEDDHALQKIADTAYDEIVGDPKLSYKYYIQEIFDRVIKENVHIVNKMNLAVRSDIYKTTVDQKYFSFRVFKKFKNAFVPSANISNEYETNRLFLRRKNLLINVIENFVNRFIVTILRIIPSSVLRSFKHYLNFFLKPNIK